MAGRILIIAKGTAFMTDAIAKNFQKAGFETTVIEPVISEIEKHAPSADIFVLFAGSYVFDSADVLVFIKDTCGESDKTLCLIGYQEEIEEVRRSIPESLIEATVERPFDMKELVAQIRKLADLDEERKKRKHILLVDDDVTFLKMMQDWLSCDYTVTITRSGMQAITYIATHTPDLILLDYDMPITPGPQVLEMIRSEPNSTGIPVIFLTGKSDRESVMKVMQLKPQGYLLKNMNRSQILKSVADFFETEKINSHIHKTER